MRKGLFIIASIFTLCFVSVEADAQRLKLGSVVGDAEIVNFEAIRVGDMIEFSWTINTTRELVNIEIIKGQPDEKQVNWGVLKTITPEEDKCYDYNPEGGQMYYKLILTDKEGLTTEYQPKYSVKGKS